MPLIVLNIADLRPGDLIHDCSSYPDDSYMSRSNSPSKLLATADVGSNRWGKPGILLTTHDRQYGGGTTKDSFYLVEREDVYANPKDSFYLVEREDVYANPESAARLREFLEKLL